MNFSNQLTSLSNHFKYYAAILLADEGPQEKVRDELTRQGWKFRSKYSEDEMKRQIIDSSAIGHGCLALDNRTLVVSPEGEEVFKTGKNRNRPLEERYRQQVRTVAADIYKID